MMPLCLISHGLSHALPKVTGEIFIDQFIITDSTLKLIIESSCNCSKLTIYNCIILMTDSFSLNPDLNYTTEHLSLEYSVSNSLSEKFILSEYKRTLCSKSFPLSSKELKSLFNFELFISVLSKTSLKSSLLSIALSATDNESLTIDPKEVLKSHKFSTILN